jgi:hypothetical protein
MVERKKVKSYRRITQKQYQLLPHSRLYHLKPIGIGAPEIECLTGYIARLAQEHMVTPYTLMLNEIVPSSKDYQALAGKAQFNLFHRPINGTGKTAAFFVNAIEELTKCDDLRFLTMLSLSGVLTSYSLIKPFRAWCPICYKEQWMNCQKCYDPLLWTLELIKWCPKHQQPLVLNCPTCESRLLHLGARSRPGYCYKCKGFLGFLSVERSAKTPYGLEHETEWQIWKSTAVGELLAATAQLLPPKRTNIAKSLDFCIRVYAWGRMSEFSSRTSISYQILWTWIKGESLPAFDTILRICFSLGISPSLFLRGSLADEQMSPSIASSQILNEHPSKSPKQSSKLTQTEVVRELQIAITTFPPLSLTDLMRKTGWGRRRLKRGFPKLCATIISRYSDFYSKRIDLVNAEKILKSALEEVPPPSLRQLTKRIGCKNTGTLHYNFPDLTEALTDRYNKHWYKQVDWKVVELAMYKALKEMPPPALQEVARRLNLNEPPYQKFPDLCKAISSRYVSYIKAKGAERRELVRQNIQKAIEEITSKGEYPSRQRVSQLLGTNIQPAEFTEAIRTLKKNQDYLGSDEK